MNNCGDCHHCALAKTREIISVVPYCAHSDANKRVVPHRGYFSNEERTEYTLAFWRVPLECPVYEGSETKCHPRDQTAITVEVADIPTIED